MGKTLEYKLPKLHAGQQTVVNSKAKFRVLMCGRRWGKSFVSIVLSLETMLKGGEVAYVTPTFSLGERFFLDIQKHIPTEIITEANKASLSIKLETGGAIKFFSGEAANSIRGRSFNRMILDECAFIPDLESLWTEAMMGCLINTDGDALFVSTPNGLDYFNSIFLKGKYKEGNYESFHFPSHSSPFVNKGFLEKIKKDVSEDTYRQEYLAEPLASSGNPFGMEHIRKNIIKELSTDDTLVYAIDVAKYHDYTVIIGLDENFNMTYFDRYRGEWSLTEEKIKALPSSVVKVMDSTGVGDVIYENLSYTVSNIHGFKFTSSSKPQLMKELIVDVQAGNIKYNETTAEEMMSFEYFLSSTGHPKYQAKSGYHDDCIMAIAMANRYNKSAIGSKNWKLYTL